LPPAAEQTGAGGDVAPWDRRHAVFVTGRDATIDRATQDDYNVEATRDGLWAVPFYGRNQAGIATAPQTAASFLAFDVTAANRGELTASFRALTARCVPDRGRRSAADPLDRHPGSLWHGPLQRGSYPPRPLRHQPGSEHAVRSRPTHTQRGDHRKDRQQPLTTWPPYPGTIDNRASPEGGDQRLWRPCALWVRG